MSDHASSRVADARYLALLDALEALVAEMQREADAYPDGDTWDTVELATRGWRDRLIDVITRHQPDVTHRPAKAPTC